MTSNNLKKLPQVGERYNCYDDGKVRPSRHSVMEIVEVLPYSKVDKELKKEIVEEQEQCDFLYAPSTDHVVIAKPLYGCCDEKENSVFIRTIDGGWFSIGCYWAARLDIDHTLTDGLIESLRDFGYKTEEIEEIIKDFV